MQAGFTILGCPACLSESIQVRRRKAATSGARTHTVATDERSSQPSVSGDEASMCTGANAAIPSFHNTPAEVVLWWAHRTMMMVRSVAHQSRHGDAAHFSEENGWMMRYEE